MLCAGCDAEIIEGQRFCRTCGTPVEPGLVAPTIAIPTDRESLSEAGKTSRVPAASTNPVGETSGAQTAIMGHPQSEPPQSKATQLMNPEERTPAAKSEPQSGQTTPSLNAAGEAPGRQTIPALNEIALSPVQASVAARGQDGAASAYITTPPATRPPRQLATNLATPPQGSRGWILALGGIALFGLIFLAFLLFGRPTRQPRFEANVPARSASSAPSGETFLSEEAATVDDQQTVFTQKFPLVGTAKFSLSNVSGDITIEGIEGAEALVTVIKTGGTVEERRDIKITYSTIGGNLSLKTPQLLGNAVQVAYVVKLPRSLSQVNVQAVNAKIKITNMDALVDLKTTTGGMDLTKLAGALRVETESGEVHIRQSSGDISVTASQSKVDLQSVNGTVAVTNTAGETRAVFESATLADSLNFESVSGNIDVRFNSELNAEFDASTTSGIMDVQGLGVDVEKATGASYAAGRVGIGGLPLKIKTVSGNIKVKKGLATR